MQCKCTLTPRIFHLKSAAGKGVLKNTKLLKKSNLALDQKAQCCWQGRGKNKQKTVEQIAIFFQNLRTKNPSAARKGEFEKYRKLLKNSHIF